MKENFTIIFCCMLLTVFCYFLFTVGSSFKAYSASKTSSINTDNEVKSFKVTPPTDYDLGLKTIAYVPRLTQACQGLNRYSKDLTIATVSASSMRGYEGGITLQFQVVSQPKELPSPLNVYSAHNTCYIDINKEGSLVYISKRACHSICEGKWQENSPGLMGREFVLQ